MKTRHYIAIAALVAAIIYGPALVGWAWDHAVVPLARVIAGVEAQADEAEAVDNTASGDVEIYVPLPEDPLAALPATPPKPTTTPVATCTVQGVAVTDGNNGMNNAPVGGAYEPCFIVAQIHGLDGLGYVVVLAPTQWLRLTAKGGAGWYVMGENLEAEIANSVKSIVARGEATPTVVRFDQGAAADSMPGIVAGPFTGPLP